MTTLPMTNCHHTIPNCHLRTSDPKLTSAKLYHAQIYKVNIYLFYVMSQLPSVFFPPCFILKRPSQVRWFLESRSPAIGWHCLPVFGWLIGWKTGAADGWGAAFPEQTNLSGSILAITWWQTAWVLLHN